MNNHQKQVRDNTSLVGFIGSRPHFPESATGFGVTGYGKIGFGEPRWAHATTRAVIPDCASKVIRNSQPIRSLRNVKPLVSEPAKAERQEIVCIPDSTFNPSARNERITEAIIRAGAKFSDIYAKGRVKTQRVEAVVVKKEERKFKPAIVGLDKTRKGKRETVPAWEREKQEASYLILYALTLRSIYRMIYGG